MAKRPVFQEVSEPTARRPVQTTGMIDARPKGARRAIRLWLMVLFAMVLAMIALGGATRLTGSGLSITEWAPVTGTLPPLNHADWQSEFEAYKQIPQYTELNAGMSLSEFQYIYLWEWSHRLLGRLIGLVWAVGFLFFWATGRIPAGWKSRLLAVGALGGLQGAIGWWMVSSGLVEGMTRVASYRLATHLGIAFVILGLIAWYALQLSRSEAELIRARRAGEAKLFGHVHGPAAPDFPADPDRRAGRGDRCGPHLYRLADHGRGMDPLGHLGRHAGVAQLL